MIITDTGTWPGRTEKDDEVIKDSGLLQPCRHCYGCWQETPGMCVIPDQLQYFGAKLSRCDELILVSRVFCGSLSPFVLSVLERAMPYVIPEPGETSLKMRYKHPLKMTAYLYGESLSERDKELVKKTVQEEGRWLNASEVKTVFMHDALHAGGMQ